MPRWIHSAERARSRIEVLARSGHDIATFAEQLTTGLQRLIPHSASCVVTLDPSTRLLTGTYKFGGLADEHGSDELWAELEYASDDPTRMTVIADREVAAVATSQLPGGHNDSIRIRQLVGPAGYCDELRMVARDEAVVWGGVNLFRCSGDAPFDESEVLALASFSKVVAVGLRAGLIVRSITGTRDTQAEGPVVLIVGSDGAIRQTSHGAGDLLTELTAEPARSPGASLIVGLVNAASRFAEGASTTLPRVRLRTPSGRWLLAHAAPLAERDHSTGEVAITIEEARPPEIAPLLASAFGLTHREREVTQLVLGGSDTRGIAEQLAMSVHTVQDHLKSIFEKAAVRSRRELTARVFFDQYAPRLAEDPSPSGWLPAAASRS